mgnify:CR=1 FL=1
MEHSFFLGKGMGCRDQNLVEFRRLRYQKSIYGDEPEGKLLFSDIYRAILFNSAIKFIDISNRRFLQSLYYYY